MRTLLDLLRSAKWLWKSLFGSLVFAVLLGLFWQLWPHFWPPKEVPPLPAWFGKHFIQVVNPDGTFPTSVDEVDWDNFHDCSYSAITLFKPRDWTSPATVSGLIWGPVNLAIPVDGDLRGPAHCVTHGDPVGTLEIVLDNRNCIRVELKSNDNTTEFAGIFREMQSDDLERLRVHRLSDMRVLRF
ncbi:hypothetical protein [Crateriforma conspicua]|nr:hypothetical protein [Crateriforma conspicua]